METKRDMATYWMERDRSTSTTHNRAHLLDSVDISIGPNMCFFVTLVSSVVHVVSFKSEVYKQLR